MEPTPQPVTVYGTWVNPQPEGVFAGHACTPQEREHIELQLRKELTKDLITRVEAQAAEISTLNKRMESREFEIKQLKGKVYDFEVLVARLRCMDTPKTMFA